MALKDNFSLQSKEYAKFRPRYPKEVFDFLVSLTIQQKLAWDCGTGNGQVASVLAESFDKVYATDISENQISHAVQKPNNSYYVEEAGHTALADHSVDLVTIAQAIHWFHFDKFYSEVRRVLKAGGVIAVIGYPLCTIDPEVDGIVLKFYEKILNGYWDPERKYLDENYETIPFPFREVLTPRFEIVYEWRVDDMIGFLNTWSAVQHYKKKNQRNPVESVEHELRKTWKENETRTVHFPVLLRIGR